MSPRNDSPFVFGNLKLPNTTAVLNICAASVCSSRMLGLCQLKDPDRECYAIREERVYPNCITSRMKMQEYWDRNSAWTIAEDLLALNETKRTKVTALRINECGDFRHQADVEKAELIAHYLKKHGIRTYCYSARTDLDFSECNDLVVNGSGAMVHNRFQVSYSTFKNPIAPGWVAEDKDGAQIPCAFLCPGDCGRCSVCQFRRGRNIAVSIH